MDRLMLLRPLATQPIYIQSTPTVQTVLKTQPYRMSNSVVHSVACLNPDSNRYLLQRLYHDSTTCRTFYQLCILVITYNQVQQICHTQQSAFAVCQLFHNTYQYHLAWEWWLTARCSCCPWVGLVLQLATGLSCPST